MSKFEERPCNKCKKDHYIVNRTHWLCEDCNYIRLHGITKLEAQIKKEKNKPNKVYQLKRKPIKKAKKQLKRSIIKSSEKTKNKRIETLKKDREVYFEVFNSKPNECEECGYPLPTEFEDENGDIIAIWQYSHIMSKSVFPEFRHKKENFNRLCLKCHQIYEFGDRESMKIYKSNQTIIKKLKDGINN